MKMRAKQDQVGCSLFVIRIMVYSLLSLHIPKNLLTING
jgi:hypothetical protein